MMESAEEFAKRIERQAADCECAECMRPLIEADRDAVALAAKREAFAEGFRVACAARYQSGAVTERELTEINPYTKAGGAG